MFSFGFNPQERRQLALALFFLFSFLFCFAVAAFNLLIPEASGPVADASPFESVSLATVGGLVAAVAGLFVMNRT